MATIYDVAKAAGVSPKTVSRVLNGDGPVRAPTRAAIERAMRELCYVPSTAARAMKSNKSGLIGLITSAISAPHDGATPTGLPDFVIVQGVQSVISHSSKTLIKVELALPRGGVESVLVNCHDEAGSACVLPDDLDGQGRLVKSLIDQGHQRLAFLTLGP